MRMEITDYNLTVKNTIKSNILDYVNVVRNIDEYGSVKYYINQSLDGSLVLFSFYCDNFDLIYNHSIKEWLETDYKGNKF